PYLLTHQGVESREPRERFWRDLRELRYPARAEDEALAVAATREKIESNRSIADREKSRVIAPAREPATPHFREGWNAGVIDKAFDGVTSWASRHGIDPGRVLLGEFGATREESILDRSRAQTRARWLHDVRCAAERRRFRWSVWELNGAGGMAVI